MKIIATRGTLIRVDKWGKRHAVTEIDVPEPCGPYKLDDCYGALILPDHGTGVVKYAYILNGVWKIADLATLKSDSTIV